MKKYNKNNLNNRKVLKIIIMLLSIIVILGISFIIYVYVNNNITYIKVNDNAKNVTDEEAKKSTPIIVNNILLGGVYNSKFVSVDKYYFNSINKKDTKIDIYTMKGEAGEYQISTLTKENNTSIVYASNTKENLISEYFAVETNSKNVMQKIAQEVEKKEEDIENVKKALGLYRILNSSVEISKVYEVNIQDSENVRIICATNTPNKSFGAYSVVVIVDEITNSAKCIKYNYVRNVDNAKDFGIISFKFACDLNGDGIKELILQETKEFEVIYSIISYVNKEYVEVLNSKLEI